MNSFFTKKYKKEKYLERFKNKINDLYASFVNHNLYHLTKGYVINTVVTGVIISIPLFSFNQEHALYKGIGIAVTLALWQYYTRWYFQTREKPWR